MVLRWEVPRVCNEVAHMAWVLRVALFGMQAAGYTGKVKIGMDVAASEFLTKDGKYDLNFKEKDNNGSQVLSP